MQDAVHLAHAIALIFAGCLAAGHHIVRNCMHTPSTSCHAWKSYRPKTHAYIVNPMPCIERVCCGGSGGGGRPDHQDQLQWQQRHRRDLHHKGPRWQAPRRCGSAGASGSALTTSQAASVESFCGSLQMSDGGAWTAPGFCSEFYLRCTTTQSQLQAVLVLYRCMPPHACASCLWMPILHMKSFRQNSDCFGKPVCRVRLLCACSKREGRRRGGAGSGCCALAVPVEAERYRAAG